MHLNKLIRRKFNYNKLISWYSGLIKREHPVPPYIHVTQVGDPILRRKAEPVKVEDLLNSKHVKRTINCLKYVLNEYNCVGLSAPQIGIGLRICIVRFSSENLNLFNEKEQKLKEMNLLPLTVVINPELKILNFDSVLFPEACESIKGFWSQVPRYKSIQVKGLDEKGAEINMNLDGWNARIIQHEVDHLNGKLYVDIMDKKSFTCSCWHAINERRGKISLPYYPS